MVNVRAIVEGYGPDFPPLETLLALEISAQDKSVLDVPIPGLARYRKTVSFLDDLTSGKRVSLERFRVITEYFIALANELDNYQGMHRNNKVVSGLTSDQKMAIRNLAITTDDIARAELIEKFTDHDTAAAGDYVKIVIGTHIPELESMIEGVHFSATSEDVMGNVFGIINNSLVYGQFMPRLLDFCDHLIGYVGKWEENGPLVLPAFTHQQAAEPTTLGNKFMTRIKAIDYLIQQLIRDGNFQPFSGKMGGAVGNLTTHYAAYPDIDWEGFAEKFVTGFGLHYDNMTDQSVSYVVEAQIYTTIANVLGQMMKLTGDFIDMASSPGQLFTKQKKKGQKGSSIMPNKSNPWGMEGAMGMFEYGRDKLLSYAKILPNYPHEGNMKRSYLMRNIGDVFIDIFIGMARVKREMNVYHPNHEKIEAIFHEYPGMSGSVIQTILKRQGIEGDAYRAIEKISINPDGSYADAKQFKDGLERTMEELSLPDTVKTELRTSLNPRNLIEPAHRMATTEIGKMSTRIEVYRTMLEQYKT